VLASCSGGGGDGHSRFTRSTLSAKGALSCDPAPRAGTGIYECVSQETGEAYECKLLPPDPDGVEAKQCAKINLDWDKPGCEDPRYIGDGKSGLQCWDPPASYCLHGAGCSQGWFCKPDASKCCYSAYYDCFRCGWIAVDVQVNPHSCRSYDTMTDLDPATCDALLTKVPAHYLECIQGQAAGVTVGCDDVYNDPECRIEFLDEICG
jgi:hypothetical protein